MYWEIKCELFPTKRTFLFGARDGEGNYDDSVGKLQEYKFHGNNLFNSSYMRNFFLSSSLGPSHAWIVRAKKFMKCTLYSHLHLSASLFISWRRGWGFSRARIYSTLRESKRGRDALVMETVTKHAFPEKHVENISNARSPGSNRGKRKFRFATNSEFKVANQHISGKKPLRKLTSNPLPPDINQPEKNFSFSFFAHGGWLCSVLEAGRITNPLG